MAKSFRIGSKVSYRTHGGRGSSSGTGKIVDIVVGQRGAWYEVQPSVAGAKPVRVRLSGLEFV